MLHLSPLESEIMNALARAKGWTPVSRFKAASTVEMLAFNGLVETMTLHGAKSARLTDKGRTWIYSQAGQMTATEAKYATWNVPDKPRKPINDPAKLAALLRRKPVRVRHGKT